MPGGDGDSRPEPDGSPQKRGRTQDQPLTLAMLKEVLAAERNIDREHLAQRLEQVQGPREGGLSRAGGDDPNGEDDGHT